MLCNIPEEWSFHDELGKKIIIICLSKYSTCNIISNSVYTIHAEVTQTQGSWKTGILS